MHHGSAADDAVKNRLDVELRLVHEAILMVAGGGSPRVVVAGLHLGEAVLEPSRRLAEEAGVRIVPLWSGDEQLIDIRVEAIEP